VPCLEKVGLVQVHFAKYTFFYAMWSYSTYFAIWTPKVSPICLQSCFCLLRKLEERTFDVLVYAQFFFCWGPSDIWWGLNLIVEMTASSVNCLLSPWSSSWLLGLYQLSFRSPIFSSLISSFMLLESFSTPRQLCKRVKTLL